MKAGTSNTLKILILKAMKAWLTEGTLELDWNFPEDEDRAGLTQALAEQQQIGWHNFFKGRISQTWTAIEQSEYSRQSQHRIHTHDDPLPKHYPGNWWAANLIKQVVFMSLNLWQIRTYALHDRLQYPTPPTTNTNRNLAPQRERVRSGRQQVLSSTIPRTYYRSESYTTSMVRDNRTSPQDERTYTRDYKWPRYSSLFL